MRMDEMRGVGGGVEPSACSDTGSLISLGQACQIQMIVRVRNRRYD